ncbi:receptor-type tyrosine- phosphatase S-like protein [Labeo rohita]|uniref:Receptor-type tyrosine-phosphatase S-like protein n=1 Tax=Labeo rohita TaxID=84645 RepID=A0A498MMT9_LABRO|nr:receptor-type tyrosine- phosphatase S-like protein [Labeo rohita]
MRWQHDAAPSVRAEPAKRANSTERPGEPGLSASTDSSPLRLDVSGRVQSSRVMAVRVGRGPVRSALLLFFICLQNSCDALSAPRFTKIPTDQIGVSGGVVSFVCQATGDPKPQVFWNKKGKKVNSQRIETIEFDEGAGAVLRIQPLRAPRDENVYECVAKNTEGEIAVTSKLSIIRVHLFNMLKTKQTDVADCQTEETETCPASAFVLGVSLAAAIGRLAASGLDLIGWPRHKGPAALHMLSVIETIARRLARGRIQNTISSVFVSFVKNWLSDVLRTGPETRL